MVMDKIRRNTDITPSTNGRRRLQLWLPALVVFLLSMIGYGFTLAPTVTGEDSGELIAAAYGAGVTHPPGYPLWTMLAWLSIKILPFGSVACKVNWLSAILAGIAAGVLCRILQRFFQVTSFTAAGGSLCFAWGRHLWSQAVIAEVYTLHILLFCLSLYFLLAWRETGRNSALYATALCVGLSLSNHHLTILIVPVIGLFVLIYRPRIFLSLKTVGLALFFLALGLLPYLYLPLAAGKGPYLNWGDPVSWSSFLRHVLRQQYGDEAMHTTRSFHRFLGHLGILGHWNLQQYTLAAVPLIVAGMMDLLRRKKFLFYFTLSLFLMNTVVLAEITNFNFQRQELYCNRVFVLAAYVISAVWLTGGAARIGAELVRLLPARRIVSNALGAAILPLLAIIVFYSNYQTNNMRHYYYASDHAGNILNSLEEDAIIIPSGDHNTFPLIYRHYVENLRPDVIIADKYGYIEYELYQAMTNAPRRIRTRLQRDEIEAYLIQHSGRPVYYTVKPRLQLLPGYEAVSYGMLFRVCKKKEKVNLPLPQYYYRNRQRENTALDHAATVILSDYHFSLAANDLRLKKRKSALAHIEKAAELSEGLKEEMNNLGTLLAEFGLDRQAVRFYEQSARLDRNYLTPRWNLAYLFKARGDVVYAIQVFNDLARLDPEDFRIFGELGFLLFQHHDMDLAIQNWGKSLALNPNQPQILQAIAKMGTSKGP